MKLYFAFKNVMFVFISGHGKYENELKPTATLETTPHTNASATGDWRRPTIANENSKKCFCIMWLLLGHVTPWLLLGHVTCYLIMLLDCQLGRAHSSRSLIGTVGDAAAGWCPSIVVWSCLLIVTFLCCLLSYFIVTCLMLYISLVFNLRIWFYIVIHQQTTTQQ